MRFDITHTFPHPPDRVASALLEESFQRSLSDIEALSDRELLSQEEGADGTVLRRTRCVLDIDLSGVAKSFIGDGDPAWIEEAKWHPDDLSWTWVIVPEVAKELLESEGTIELRPAATGTDRVVLGEVKVRVPLYGGKVEGWIVDGIRQAYDEEAARLARWLERENA